MVERYARRLVLAFVLSLSVLCVIRGAASVPIVDALKIGVAEPSLMDRVRVKGVVIQNYASTVECA